VGDEGRTLPWRQDLECGQERQLDRLAFDGHGVGFRIGGRDLVQQGIGVRLDPRHPADGPHRRRPAVPAADQVDADVRRDAVQPRAEQLGAVEPVPAPPGAEERLLDGVLRVVERGQHAVAVDVQLAPVTLGERGEGGLVALDRRAHRDVGHAQRSARGFSAPRSCSTHVLPSGSAKSANEL
jgi:hypothetical protein